jgi:AraC family transcriptional activator of tynA and feaB
MSNAQQVERFDQWLDKVNQVCGRFGANVLGTQFAGSIDEYRNNARQLSLILPREQVEQQLRFTTVKPAQRIPVSAPMAGLAQRLILGSTEQGLNHTESEATLDAVISLLRPAMGASEVDDSSQTRTFHKALRVIDEHIGDEARAPNGWRPRRASPCAAVPAVFPTRPGGRAIREAFKARFGVSPGEYRKRYMN